MIHLQANSPAAQTIHLTLQEKRRILAAEYTHYLLVLEHYASRERTRVIPAVSTETPRYTALEVYTNETDASNGRFLVDKGGVYFYFVYAQNSATNTNENNGDVVVGLLEQGLAKVADEPLAQLPGFDVPDNIIYYE